jgi:RNA polymerase sigma-70 factor, ECF subfamily
MLMLDEKTKAKKEIAIEDSKIIQAIKANDLDSFEQLFRSVYPSMVVYARKFVNDVEVARDLAQEVFLNLWENRERTEFHTSLKSYLFRSVHNRCLNYIRHVQVRDNYHEITEQNMREIEFDYFNTSQSTAISHILEGELEQKINDTINLLPEQCRRVFLLSRYHDKSNQEIAEELNLSVRTVETQIYRALKVFRVELKEYL